MKRLSLIVLLLCASACAVPPPIAKQPQPEPTPPARVVMATVRMPNGAPVTAGDATLSDDYSHQSVCQWQAFRLACSWPEGMVPGTQGEILISDVEGASAMRVTFLLSVASLQDIGEIHLQASHKILPPVPGRAAVTSVNLEWQGLTVFGEPWFEPYLGWRDYTREQRAEVYRAKRQPRPGAPNGDTHLMLSLDMTGLAGLSKLKALVREYIAEEGGAGVQLMCMGDGNEAGRENHDPGALNWPWLMANFPAIYDYFKHGPDGEDLTPWVVFVPGFDGVVPGWQPWDRVNQFARMARAVIDRGGTGYLGLELSAGYAVWTGETNDWATEDGKRFDVIIQEFPIDVHPEYGPPASLLNPDRTWRSGVDNDQRNPWSQVYQIVGRMVRPFNRPAYMPNDDLNPSFHLHGGTPRGPFVYVCGEVDTYRWVRASNISLAEVNAHREALLSMGCSFVG